MVGDEDIEASKMLDGCCDQGAGRIWAVEVAGDGVTVGSPAFLGQSFSLLASFLIAEDYFCARGGEHADRGRADAAGAAGDQGYFVGEG